MRPVVMCQHQWYCYSEVTPVALVGVTPKAFLLLNPPWSTNFNNDRVTLTCRDSLSPAQGDISWYHNDHLLDNISEEIQIHKTGYYKCKTQRSSPSDPVHMDFLPDRLIIQAPHPVFEGDDVVLRCRGREATSETVFYKNKKEIRKSYISNFTLNSVSRDNDKYYCTASRKGFWGVRRDISKPLTIQVQELFPPPVLTARPSQPIEGRPVTLKCETWLPPQRSYIQLQFCFFREDQALGSGWSSSPELNLPNMWSENSGSYWCQAETVTHHVRKRSLRSQIHVQRIPVSDVNLEIQPPEGQLIEGENLLLICSVANGTGTVTFSWHREGTVRSLGTKTQRSLSAELQILTVKEHDAGRYYCAADNIHGPIVSKLIRVTLRIPVSHPVFTFHPTGAQAIVGDVLELRCEAQRGSPPILYWFYHKNVTLGSILDPFGGGASFNLTLMAEHSGNFSCGADNGLGVQRSEMVTLSVTGPSSNKIMLITEGVTAGLLSILGLAATAALVCYFRTQRNSGGLSTTGTPSYSPREFKEPSRTSNTDPQEPTYSEPPDPMEQQPVCSNVDLGESNLVYSQICSIQDTKENSANSPKKHWEHKEPEVIYSELKKAHLDDSAGLAINQDRDLEDAAENYENVPCALSAIDN
ncbi:Fc receptor-like protein 3 isoform X2 [Phocoena sinus]|uniref:Fc receptor-like protein 3 isoform X2 n=1 Tax=Phocoena sinus TaxID=42100 RepID=UPI0013C424AB|nr:Fc receptor-like protein 3 isoform X2 [Phocoena sinus]